jgi:hypothetical protein
MLSTPASRTHGGQDLQETQRPSFAELLARAVSEPGTIHRAYSSFHNFSIANQMLALEQCAARGLAVGPLASYNAWKERGRHVKRGERAIWLWMPIICHRKVADEHGDEHDETVTRFAFKPHWFLYGQTEGAEMPAPVAPGWDRRRALEALEITEAPFAALDGNTLGYAKGRTIAVSPVNPIPHKTTFHELAHVQLGHTAEPVHEAPDLPRSLREVEAEAVALICCEALGLEGAEYARGYIQSWLRGETIPDASAQRIFKVADQILRAGRA